MRNDRPLSNRELTAETTRRILDFLFDQKIDARRNNVLGIPVLRAGAIVGFRSGSRSGEPDIIGDVPKTHELLTFKGFRPISAVPFGVEIKTGKDKLSEIQKVRFEYYCRIGKPVFEVTDYMDFRNQWINYWIKL